MAPFVDAVPGDSTFSPVRSAAVVCECGLVSSCPSGGLLLGGWGGALLACPAGLPCGVSWCLKEDLGWTAFGDHQGTVPHSLTVVFSFPGIVLGAYTPASSNGGILFLIVAFPRFVMEIEYPSGRLGCKTHYHTNSSLSTPRKDSARLVSRRPVSADAVKASKPIGRLLGKRRTITGPEAPSTLKCPRTGLSARRALFSVKKAKPGVIFFSLSADWRNRLGQDRLPRFVSIGLCVPWGEQSCPLCSISLPTARAALVHMRRLQMPWRLHYLCARCSGTFK